MSALMIAGSGASRLAPLGLLFESSLKVALVLGAVFLLCRMVAKAPAAVRHLFWTMGLAVALAIPLVTTQAPWRLELLPSFVVTPPPPVVEVEPLPVAAVGAEEVVATVEAPVSFVPAEPIGGRQASRGSIASNAANALWTQVLPTALLLVWLGGAVVVLARAASGALHLRRIVRGATPVGDPRWLALASRVAKRTGVSGIRLLRSRSIGVPAAVGLRRPAVLLPPSADEWTEARLEAVLLHEVAHVQRGDLFTQWLAQITCAFYWFHPLVWEATRRMRAEGERACDDLVLGAGVRASDYAEHLLHIAQGSDGAPMPAAALGLTGESDFERRLAAILEPDVRHDAPSPVAVAGAAVIFACVALPVAALSAAVQSQDPAATDQQTQADPRAVSALTELLADSSRSVREAAIDALGELRATSAVPRLLELLEDPSSSVRRSTVRALGEIGDARAVTALSGAVALDRDRNVRRSAVWSLGEIGDETATGFLVQAMRTSPDRNVREAAVEALGEVGNTAAVNALAELIATGDRELVGEALESLADIQTPEALDVLIGLTRSPDPRLRREAAQALGERG